MPRSGSASSGAAWPRVALTASLQRNESARDGLPLCHQGTAPASSKNLPVGPPSARVASWIAIAAPWAGVRTPLKPLRSVAVKPGEPTLIRMFVSYNSLAYWMVTALRKVFDGA